VNCVFIGKSTCNIYVKRYNFHVFSFAGSAEAFVGLILVLNILTIPTIMMLMTIILLSIILFVLRI